MEQLNPTAASSFPGGSKNEFNDLTVTHDRENWGKEAAAPDRDSEFNDLTVTHDRDNWGKAPVTGLAGDDSAPGTSEFNDMTITHDRDNWDRASSQPAITAMQMAAALPQIPGVRTAPFPASPSQTALPQAQGPTGASLSTQSPAPKPTKNDPYAKPPLSSDVPVGSTASSQPGHSEKSLSEMSDAGKPSVNMHSSSTMTGGADAQIPDAEFEHHVSGLAATAIARGSRSDSLLPPVISPIVVKGAPVPAYPTPKKLKSFDMDEDDLDELMVK